MYDYLKSLHIIFVITWFAGMFYIVRLFIYNTEANEKAEPERSILQRQFNIMIKRLWLGITWPSAIVVLLRGSRRGQAVAFAASMRVSRRIVASPCWRIRM